MEVKSTPIEGLLIIQPQVFGDERGHFFEPWNKNRFAEHGLTMDFVQDNQSLSQKGVLRGLHFQKPPFAQGKLVRVIKGAALDVVVDIRKDSPTYGQHFSIELNESNHTMFYVPEGFAHGFLTLENNTIFSYKVTALYHPEAEDGIMWNDPALGIDWGISDPQLSGKDRVYKPFREFSSLF